MPHIHTKPGEYDHTASTFLVRTDGKEPKIMLHQHKKLGRYMQFGGHIETNETPWEAVTHELLEESGYEMGQMKVLQPGQRMQAAPGGKLHPVPIYHTSHQFNDDDHYHTDVAYALVTGEEPLHEVVPEEKTEIILLTRDELVKMPEDRVFPSVREAALFVFDVCLKEWQETDPSIFD